MGLLCLTVVKLEFYTTILYVRLQQQIEIPADITSSPLRQILTRSSGGFVGQNLKIKN